jgi:imidazolonepropionase-like amidohydrolase
MTKYIASKILSTLFLTATYAVTVQAQNPVPAKAQTKKILIKGGTAHIGNGKVIDNAAIGFVNGKITFVGNAASANTADFDTVINGTGKQIYPGFIGMNTVMGLSEIEAVRATNDARETGSFNPSTRAIIAYNTDNKSIPTVRCDGVLLCQIVPQGGMVSGQSAVVQMDAWNWQDAAYTTDEGIHLNWPNMRVYRSTYASPIDEQQDRTQKSLESIQQLFKDARYYYEAKPTEININLEAMKGLFDGSKKLYVHADYVRQIIAAVNFCHDQKIQMVLVGGDDAYKVTDLLKENHVPVVLGQTHALPGSVDADIDLPYKMPYLLQKAGVEYCISVGGFWQVRTLGYNAGQAVSYGLTKEQALAAITSSPAKILGIDKTVGTLETGKDATLFISKGDALDMLGNNLDAAFISGRNISLDNVQKQLYVKYMDKYGLKR